jgi:hypothetical protein
MMEVVCTNFVRSAFQRFTLKYDFELGKYALVEIPLLVQ